MNSGVLRPSPPNKQDTYEQKIKSSWREGRGKRTSPRMFAVSVHVTHVSSQFQVDSTRRFIEQKKQQIESREERSRKVDVFLCKRTNER